MKIKLLALSLISIFSIGAAQADEMWGSHSSTEQTSFGVSYFSFYDELFYFELDKNSSLKVTAGTNFNRPSQNSVDLYNFDTGEDVGSFQFGTTVSSAYFNDLSAGNYFYEVSGGNYGTQIGQVSFSSTIINAVPEPETYAMLLAGLGALGFVARRRKTV